MTVGTEGAKKEIFTEGTVKVLIIGAGRVCQPAVELLVSVGSNSSRQLNKTFLGDNLELQNRIHVIVASLYLKDAEEVPVTFFPLHFLYFLM